MKELARRCYRYLAVVAALTSEADYVFVPECPPPDNWQKRLCEKLEQVPDVASDGDIFTINNPSRSP